MAKLMKFSPLESVRGKWHPTVGSIAINPDFVISVREITEGVTAVQVKGNHPLKPHSTFSDSHHVTVMGSFDYVTEVLNS